MSLGSGLRSNFTDAGYADTMGEDNTGAPNMVSPRSLDMMLQVGTNFPDDSMSLAEQIMHRFEAALSIGILSRGDRLPPESDLAEHLGVSPLTLRHGLHMLRQRGLVATRRGRGGGSYISGQVIDQNENTELRLQQIDTDGLRDLFDLAASAGRAAARLGAMRTDASEVAGMRAWNEHFLKETTNAGLRRADSRFHIELGVLAQSPQLTSLLVRVQSELAPMTWWEKQIAERKSTAYDEHNSIIDAIASGNHEEAESLTTKHIEKEQVYAIEHHLRLLMTEKEL